MSTHKAVWVCATANATNGIDDDAWYWYTISGKDEEHGISIYFGKVDKYGTQSFVFLVRSVAAMLVLLP